jgi:uncharacterized membrane protein YkvA (DUF1232 family)
MPQTDQPKGFNKAKKQAEKILDDGKRVKGLIEQGIAKSKENKNALSGFWNELQSLIRMINAQRKGLFKVSTKSVLWAIAAVVYFVNPLDVIPDMIFGLGFIDDATVIAFVVKSIKRDLERFQLWEQKEISSHSTREPVQDVPHSENPV